MLMSSCGQGRGTRHRKRGMGRAASRDRDEPLGKYRAVMVFAVCVAASTAKCCRPTSEFLGRALDVCGTISGKAEAVHELGRLLRHDHGERHVRLREPDLALCAHGRKLPVWVSILYEHRGVGGTHFFKLAQYQVAASPRAPNICARRIFVGDEDGQVGAGPETPHSVFKFASAFVHRPR